MNSNSTVVFFLKSLERNIFLLFFLYIFLTIFLYFLRPSFIPTPGILFVQSLLNLGFLFCLFVGNRLKFKQLFCFVFLYQWCISILVRQILWINYGSPFGYGPVDAVFYQEQGLFLKNLSLGETFMYFLGNDIDVDDWGFILIQRFIYLLGGTQNGGLFLSLFFNSLSVTLSAFFIYRLAGLLLDQPLPKFLFVIWGCIPVVVDTSVTGTKENYFLLCILGAMYYMYRYFQRRSPRLFLLFIFYCAAVYLFRYAVAFMMILSFLLGCICYNRVTRKFLPFFICVGIIASVTGFYMIISYIGEILGKTWITTVLDYQLTQSSQNPFITMVVNILAAFIGPFPNFIGTEEKTHTFIYSLVPFLKMCVSYFYLIGIYYIIRRKLWHYYPLVLFTLLNTLMIIFTYFSLHVRYNMPHIPFMMIIACLGFWEYKKRNSGKYSFKFYLMIVVALMFVFNLRFS